LKPYSITLRQKIVLTFFSIPNWQNFLFLRPNLINNIMKDLVARINAEIETFKTESESLTEKGIKAAGARARKSSLELEKLFKEFRKVSIAESK
jgi:hypothetical protein